MTKYNAIILPDKVYISDQRTSGYNTVDLTGFIFDCGEAKETNKKGWYELPCLPKTVRRRVLPPTLISSYKLRDGFVSTDKLPATVSADFFAYDDDAEEYLNGEIKGLYEPVLEKKEPYLENVEFEISTIAHKNSNWKFVAQYLDTRHQWLKFHSKCGPNSLRLSKALDRSCR